MQTIVVKVYRKDINGDIVVAPSPLRYYNKTINMRGDVSYGYDKNDQTPGKATGKD